MPGLVAVHHIGSTAVPGLLAKPILDLLPVAAPGSLDALRPGLEALGYRWHGALGIAGRRYCTLDGPAAGTGGGAGGGAAAPLRLVQLHCFAAGDPGIVRHLAFRDLLRAEPALAARYAEEKRRCAALHPGNSVDYGECKGGWVARVEREALARHAPAAGP